MIKKSRFAVLAVLACAALAAARAASQDWTRVELRVNSLRGAVRSVREVLSDGSPGARRLARRAAAAFAQEADAREAARAYDARRKDLLARADELDRELDQAAAGNIPGEETKAGVAAERAGRGVDLLRADFEFYSRLPLLSGRDREAGQAAMRLLGETGEYPETRAFLTNRLSRRTAAR